MLEVLGVVLGLLLGPVLALVPGMHPALVLALVVVTVPASVAVPLIATAVGTGIYVRHLGQVYAPCSQDLAAAEPALKLASMGQSKLAVRTMVSATDVAMTLVVVLAITVVVAMSQSVNLPKTLDHVLGPTGVIVICFWLVTVVASSPKANTVMGIAGVATFGYCVLHAPALVGDRYQLSPLMVGLFTIPIGLQLWSAERVQSSASTTSGSVSIEPGLGLLGAGLGLVTGFLAGLGSGSLVSMFSPLVDNEDEVAATAGYLFLASAAAAANDLLAIVLVVTAAMGRSGEAVALGQVCQQPSTSTAALVIGTMLLAAIVGRNLVFALEDGYNGMMGVLDPRIPAAFVIVLGLVQVMACREPVAALAFTGCGTCLGLWLKGMKVPQQVSFSALALPLVAQWCGLVPWCNAALFH